MEDRTITKKMINIRLDSNLWKHAKLDAVSKGITLQDWLEMAIQQCLRQKISKASR